MRENSFIVRIEYYENICTEKRGSLCIKIRHNHCFSSRKTASALLADLGESARRADGEVGMKKKSFAPICPYVNKPGHFAQRFDRFAFRFR